MKREVNILSVSYLIFLALLIACGAFSGILSDTIYFLSFLLPFLLVLYMSRDKGFSFSALKLSREGAIISLPFVFPSVLIIFGMSLLTSLLIFATTGLRDTVDVGNDLFSALFSHAALPAITEELLFRYIPMRLLSDKSKRATVFLSAFFFALVHHSFFSIPYAFVAGIIFITLDLVTESILPSVFLHFINNAVAVLWILYSKSDLFALCFLITIGVLSLISLAFIFRFRKKYVEKVKAVWQGDKIEFTPELILFALPTIIMAVSELV